MREVSGILMTYDEFKGIVEEVTDCYVKVVNDNGNWFYGSYMNFDCSVKNINKLLSEKFRKTVVNVILDLSNENEEDVFIELKN